MVVSKQIACKICTIALLAFGSVQAKSAEAATVLPAPATSTITAVNLTRTVDVPFIKLMWEYKNSTADVFYFDRYGARKSFSQNTGKWNEAWFNTSSLTPANVNPDDITIGSKNVVIAAGQTLFEFRRSTSDISYAIVNRNLIVSPWTAGGSAAAQMVSPTGTPPVAGTFPRNNNALFEYKASTASASLSMTDRNLTLAETAANIHSGATNNGDGNFRIGCQWSHFSYDDPILKPNQQGAAHLHMFFGNTKTDYTTIDGPTLVKSGGGSCNGFALNRSAYWAPALMSAPGKAVVPKQIIVYYKSKTVCNNPGNQPKSCAPDGVAHTTASSVKMPQGLELISGNNVGVNLNEIVNNVQVNGQPKHKVYPPSNTSQHVFWSCGSSGDVAVKFNKIPTLAQCKAGQDPTKAPHQLNATIYFPQCWNGQLSSADPQKWDHVRQVEVHEKCPASHPKRLPQLALLLYWDLTGVTSLDGWRLSSDPVDQNGNIQAGYVRGGTLHADWMAGWNDAAQDAWLNGCVRGEKNCTYGQTATTNRLRYSPQDYTGPYVVDVPVNVHAGAH